jgi:hypothetical protein
MQKKCISLSLTVAIRQQICIQGVSEIRVLILTSGRTRQFKKLFSITFLRERNTNGFKMWNKIAIKVSGVQINIYLE